MFQIRLTPVVKKLLIVNIIMWAITAFAPILNLGYHLAMYDVSSEHFQPWQFITHIFMHSTSRDGLGNVDISHIIGNSLGLVFLGPMLEGTLGSKKFFSYYLLTGLGAAALHLSFSKLYINYLNVQIYDFASNPTRQAFFELANDLLPRSVLFDNKNFNDMYNLIDKNLSPKLINEEVVQVATNFLNDIVSLKANVPMVGASGAIYGLLAALGILYGERKFQLLFLPISIKIKWIAIFMIGSAFMKGIVFDSNDNVAHVAHLGGALIGALLIYQWKRSK
jgi:membrane associated rhomboid family serine protease